MADVFISYHVESASAIVKEIVEVLEAREIGTGSARRNISCWYSGRDVPPGEHWPRRVLQEIQNCYVFVPVLDRGSIEDSVVVEGEIDYACSQYKKFRGKSINIIPYKWEDCDLGELALYLSRFQRIDAIPHTPQSLEALTKAVVSAVESMREQEDEEKLSQRLLKENRLLRHKNQAIQKEKRTLLHKNQTFQEKNRALQEECQKLRERLSRRCHETPGPKIPEPSIPVH